MPRYNPAEIEPKWQTYWEANRTFATPEMTGSEKLYVLDMFPYPSGDGLHVGHPEGYTATDIVCRFERMRGKTVLHPMGFDAFGLPAEEHAIRTNTPPRESTERNIANFRRQLKMLGFSYDWDREIATTDVPYFRWTQWIFTLLFDTWYDSDQQRGRPIDELPIPDEIRRQGDEAVRDYQDDHRLAYQSDALVNWCPALGTVLANEEVQDGVSERGGHPVQRIPLRQWMLRITAYGDRLERDLEQLDWSESVKKLQREWIGRSLGAEVDFYIGSPESYDTWKSGRAKGGYPRRPGEDVVRIYTTRPDTLFGATYMVLAPEHPLVDRLTTDEHRDAVTQYQQQVAAKSDRERTDLTRRKTGVFTGGYARNPVNGAEIPVWIADYVLASYGTGAIMAVPAHDDRDFEFAKQFQLPIIAVVESAEQDEEQRAQVRRGDACFVGQGVAIQSGPYDGLATETFKARIAEDLQRDGVGRQAVNYKLRDWLFSRQRFWGEPFPVLHELDAQGKRTGRVRCVPDDQLPVDLPELADYKPHGKPEPPLAKAPDDWLYPVLDGRRYQRETNTMPQWAGSCWYYLRFIDPRNDQAFVDPEKERAWMPVDLYVGGAEHAVLHLLYSRFWHKVLYDRGHVSTPEPFQRLVNQGMILGDIEYTGYQTEEGDWISRSEVDFDEDKQPRVRGTNRALREVMVDPEQVEKQGDAIVLTEHPEVRVESRAYKMSKSRGNVVNPDEVVRDYGADSLRLYEMFMGPLEATKPWSMRGVNGVRNFLDRAWRMIVDDRSDACQLCAAVQKVPMNDEQTRWLHRTIKAVTNDTERLSFNTAIARMMEFVNYFTKQSVRPWEAMEGFVLLIAPYAPHFAEELWNLLGHADTLAYEKWPAFDEQLTIEQKIEVPVQVNGKVRTKISVPPGSSVDQLLLVARGEPRVGELLAGKQIVKEIAIPDRMVNFVVR
jgi:leucyl-tRNA synthetase